MNKPSHYGILAAILAIGLYLVLYFVEKQLIVNPFVKSLRYPIYIVVAWIAVGKYRSMMEDKSMLVSWIRPAFMTFVVASTVFTIFEFVLFRFVDHELYQLSASYLNEHFPELQAKGVPGRTNTITPVSIEEAVTISRTIFSLALEVVIGFLFSFFIGMIRRNKG